MAQSFSLTLTKDVHEETAKLYAVGDRYAKVAYLNLNLENFALGPIGVLDLTNAILDRFSVCQSREILQCKRQSDLLTSQWEAINVDTKGQIYLLNEQLASIFSFNPDDFGIAPGLEILRTQCSCDFDLPMVGLHLERSYNFIFYL